MKANRLSGHELRNEGRIGGYGMSNGSGPTKCSCGQKSPVLPSTGARKKWHREHKDQIRATS